VGVPKLHTANHLFELS